MDPRPERQPSRTLSALHVIGLGSVIRGAGDDSPLDVAPCLRDRKALKFMAKQDKLAVIAANAAVAASGLGAAELDRDTGIYFAVGTLPFENEPLDLLHRNSVDDSGTRFDLKRFSTAAFNAMNPLLTFKCLPNMPVFHVSYQLGMHGPYFVTYPGPGQWFAALERAFADLETGRVRFALVGAVADQRNPLVEHHARRTGIPESSLADAACVLVLTRGAHATQTPRALLAGIEVSYDPLDPFAETRAPGALSSPVDPVLAIARMIESRTPGNYRMSDGTGLVGSLTVEVPSA